MGSYGCAPESINKFRDQSPHLSQNFSLSAFIFIQDVVDFETILTSCTFSIRARWAVPTLRNHQLFGLLFSQQEGGARYKNTR